MNRATMFAASLVLGSCLLAPHAAPAQDAGLRQDGEGRYGRLSASWWQWVLRTPAVDVGGTNTNPVLDSTGEFATTGQEDGQGPGNQYFFLAGSFGGSVTRSVTVPQGKTLFFPIYNWEYDNAVAPPTDYTVPELRAIVTGLVDAYDISAAYSLVDGQPVEIFRTKHASFSYTLPDEDSIYDYFGLVGPQFEGTIKPAVADGYWSVVPPLSPGEHIVEFGSSLPGAINATYYLTVE